MGISPLDPSAAGARPDRKIHQGHDRLGPSDSSDSGSDVQGLETDSDSDRFGTGERAAAEDDVPAAESPDIDTDHVEVIPENTGNLDEEKDDEG